ncbi:helix-turn-helix domain-containing protein [Arthrobacter sp. zg-Y877]|uniref:GAF domain-containing protein n=1 Tax=Arthrobacter sp. zg-Y877 TaxID=3049074 RepID=UPI0025A31F12|nr:helix-turn-helix domain-containing protein [Arthrobacter sp. zg-Y877]MDM7990107.1 transcriptional regulator [Arthrobacter sp. zg-Y877]
MSRTGQSGVLPRVPADILQRNAVRAHESLGAGTGWLERLRPSVRESWQRSLQHHPDPDIPRPELVFDGDALVRHRAAHPLSSVMPVIRRLLVEPGEDSGLLVAVGDELGRLLWVDGDPVLRRRAEGMLFMAGADWSERTVGTSAPGMALATASEVQIAGPEHFSRLVHSWSCTAVPVHDPDTGAVLGVVDVTGGSEAVAPHTLALVRAAVAAAEARLQVERLQAHRDTARRPQASGSRDRAPQPSRRRTRRIPTPGFAENLEVLGRDRALLHTGGRAVELSARHGELLAVLALHPAGLTAEELAALAYPDAHAGTVRAEMVRLRNLMEAAAAGTTAEPLVPRSRPYRLARPLAVDAVQVLRFLEQGAYRLALRTYGGPVLSRSEAPAVVRLRTEVSAVLREAILSDAGTDTLLQYLQLPEAAHDAEAWQLALRVLPPRSPRRAAVVAALERIERDLA